MHFLTVFTLFYYTLRFRFLGTPSGQWGHNFVRAPMLPPMGNTPPKKKKKEKKNCLYISLKLKKDEVVVKQSTKKNQQTLYYDVAVNKQRLAKIQVQEDRHI